MVERFKQGTVVTGVGFGGGEVASTAAQAFQSFGGMAGGIAEQAAQTRGIEEGQEALLSGDTQLKSAYTQYGNAYNSVVKEGSAAQAKNDADSNLKRIYDESMVTGIPDQAGYYEKSKAYMKSSLANMPEYLRAPMMMHMNNQATSYGTAIDSDFRKFTVDQTKLKKSVAYSSQRDLATTVARQGDLEQGLMARQTYGEMLEEDTTIGFGDKKVLFKQFGKDMEMAYVTGSFARKLGSGDIQGAMKMLGDAQNGKFKSTFTDVAPDVLADALEGEFVSYNKNVQAQESAEEAFTEARYDANFAASTEEAIGPGLTKLQISEKLLKGEISTQQASQLESYSTERTTVDNQDAINAIVLSDMTAKEKKDSIASSNDMTPATKEKHYKLALAEESGMFSTNEYTNAEDLIKSVAVTTGMFAQFKKGEQEDFARSKVELQTLVTEGADPIVAAEIIINSIAEKRVVVKYNTIEELEAAAIAGKISEDQYNALYPLVEGKIQIKNLTDYFKAVKQQ